MSRKPQDIVIYSLRIRESLRRKLEREAQRRHTSINNEIRERLERSFLERAEFDLPATVESLKISWAPIVRRLGLAELEDQLAYALTETKDHAQAVALAQEWLKRKRIIRTLQERDRALVEEQEGGQL